MIVHYKCPNCGSDMEFNPNEGNLHCDSCGRVEDIDQMLDDTNSAPGDTTYDFNEEDKKLREDSFEYDYTSPTFADEEAVYNQFDNKQAKQYHCNNCGATLITDEITTATTCNFCGAGVVLGDRLTGVLAPSKVIPFSISKEEAQIAFKKWCKNGRLSPKDFATADRITGITGLYVPFWLYDLNGRGEISATCTRVRTYTRGNYIYTETKYYNVYRKVDLDYLKVPCDASKKMDDSLMDKLEPFPFQNLKDFKMPYLTGYIAEKYDYDNNQLLPRVKNRVTTYLDNHIRSTITGYTTVSIHHKDLNVRQTNASYTLLPVWMLSYDYKQSNHSFVMNGQTGKIAGTPPISKQKVFSWFAGISLGCFTLFRILSLILGGGL